MKKYILLILTSINFVYSQYQIIYNPPQNRTIQTIALFKSNQNNVSFYLHLSGNNITAQAPYWIRYFRTGNSWDQNPHNGMLNGMTCFNGTGGFAWSQNTAFKKSAVDTNFILTRFDWISCIPIENGYYNRISYNAGTTFNQLNSATFNSFDIDNVNDSIIYGVGASYLQTYKFWRTTNKGSSWINQDIGGLFHEPSFLVINPLKRNEIFFSKLLSFYKSTNSGVNYSGIYSFSSPPKQIEIDRVDTSIFVVTNHGVFKSTNGGANFTQVSGTNFNKILFHPENHLRIYAAALNGIHISLNGGLSWNLYFDNFTGSANVGGLVKYPNDGDTIYASNSSGLYKIWASAVGINFTEIPVAYSLFQNYPNPFNPVTSIKFQVPRPSFVNLIIYDLLGREVATLVNGQLIAGTYQADWDASSFPSGVYLYKLTAGEYAETRKMVLLK